MTTLTAELLTSTSMTKIFNFELFKVSNQDRDDVKQDCVIRIMKALKKNEGEIPVEKLPSFCQTIIKRTVVDYYRKANRKIEQNSTYVFFADGGYDGEDSGEGANTVNFFSVETTDYGYDVSDIRTDFEINRHKFTKTEQNVIEYMLYSSHGLHKNLSEIALELQVNKSHTTRAFKKLRDIYGN